MGTPQTIGFPCFSPWFFTCFHQFWMIWGILRLRPLWLRKTARSTFWKQIQIGPGSGSAKLFQIANRLIGSPSKQNQNFEPLLHWTKKWTQSLLFEAWHTTIAAAEQPQPLRHPGFCSVRPVTFGTAVPQALKTLCSILTTRKQRITKMPCLATDCNLHCCSLASSTRQLVDSRLLAFLPH